MHGAGAGCSRSAAQSAAMSEYAAAAMAGFDFDQFKTNAPKKT
jgi:hypothetical protein